MAEEYPNNRSVREQSKKQADHEVPMAYAEASTDFDGVYALPLASANTPSALFRLTAEQESKLQEYGFPLGLSQELVRNTEKCPIRFFLIDNSGSMWTSDGHVLRGRDKNTQLVPCTRWAEMQATVECHADMAGVLEAATVFLLLNPPGDPRVPQKFSVAEHGSGSIPGDIDRAKQAMLHCQPQGPTPLVAQLTDIREMIMDFSPQLTERGQKVTIVVATDGLPTDSYGGSSSEASREFVQILRSLQNYPVWLVIRLCTDDEETRNFYNSLDEELELPLEVLDDHVAEAKEVARYNSWLNYAQPLHRTRELGYQHRLFDLLDERPLNKDEVKEFLELLFGSSVFESAPDVHKDWRGFAKGVSRVIKNQKYQWNPRSHKMEPWVDVKKLDKVFGERLGLFSRMGSSAKRTSNRKSIR